jgi:type I restriction enzyme S subunit
MQTARLQELCNLITDGTHDSPKLLPSGIPFIKGKHISSGRIDFDNCDFISEADHRVVISRSKPEKGDTLFSNIGSVGDAAFIDTDTEFSIKNIALFKPDPTKIVPKYLYYLLRSDRVRNEFLAIKSGAAQPFLSLGTLRGHSVHYHSCLEVQKRIASILGAYDDLIEVNRRRVAVLEEMARGLFEEWFVRFRFPGHETVPILDTPDGSLPEGWRRLLIKDAVQRLSVGRRFSQKEARATGDIPILDQSKDGVIGYHSEAATVTAQLDNPVITFANHTCYQRVIHFPFSAIQNVLPFKPSVNVPNAIYWLHHATSGKVKLNDYKGHWPDYVSKDILVPNNAIAARFDKIVRPTYLAVCNCQNQNKLLAASRDLLLPRLISGELSVASAERELEEVA